MAETGHQHESDRNTSDCDPSVFGKTSISTQAGMSVLTIESFVSNLVVSEDIQSLETRAAESELDECPPKRQRISEESIGSVIPASLYCVDTAAKSCGSDREGLDLEFPGKSHLKTPSPDPDTEEEAPCQYHDCFITQYSSPGHVHVLSESAKSRSKTRKTVVERNHHSYHYRQGVYAARLVPLYAKSAKQSSGDVSRVETAALPWTAGEGCTVGDTSALTHPTRSVTEADCQPADGLCASTSYTSEKEKSLFHEPMQLSEDKLLSVKQNFYRNQNPQFDHYSDTDPCDVAKSQRSLKREAKKKYHTRNKCGSGCSDKTGSCSHATPHLCDGVSPDQSCDEVAAAATTVCQDEDVPRSSKHADRTAVHSFSSSSLHTGASYLDGSHSFVYSSTTSQDVMPVHFDQVNSPVHSPNSRWNGDRHTSGKQLGEEVGREHLKNQWNRFVHIPDLDSSDSTSLSSEPEDSGSDSSMTFSSLSGTGCHDESLHGDQGESCTSPQPKEPATINDLPTVVLIQIFSLLPLTTRLGAVNRVCKAWQSAVLDPSLWRYLDLTDLPRLKDSALLQVASLSDRVHTLVMTDGKSTLLTDGGMVKVLQQCSYLQRVDISQSFFLSNESFSALGKYCHMLRRINFDGCFSLADVSLEWIGSGCPELQELNISQCSKVSDKGVCAVARGCPLLTKFRLDQCVKVTDEGVIALTEHCPNLEYLHLLSCSLTDIAVSHLGKLRKLHTLDISNISHLSPRCLEIVAMGCCKLETLGLSLNRAVDDQCLRTVAQFCPGLKNLSCVACSLSDAGLEYLGKYARNLERLDVAWCGDITEVGISAVAAGCPNLSYLGFMRCSRASMPVVEELVYKYPHIKFSNFFLESKRLLAKAQRQGFTLPPTALLADR